MIYGVFAIFDTKALMYSQPFYAPNAAVAQRMFRDQANQPGVINSSPGDFTLTRVGHFDDSSGQLLANEESTPVIIVNADSLIKPEV